ncbi:hypothetical protein HZP84_08755 [Elizabethkingia anophelis]|uniref:Uncharacterized protein n=2 Tax=Elizabethkingia anophelis TaxID=1117645 RepID=A0A077EGL2_9FLAO|nr:MULTISPECIES: hypothetical protein [Elizabethkingia]AIL46776.1 hypothetical protein BD94_3001 [Elizabethkingia anophelis NUHP1]EJC8061979.1 hypothetical protein [Elizabethkingia anophelis]KMU64213.1 hypothetical protein EZBTHKR_1223 [Elizabethkingia anophelis]MBE9392381.1 hypothetical protein [Elizabethkingia anophelis]MBE9406682.1 hypothetical protein [Elizabethkingia anophelis]
MKNLKKLSRNNLKAVHGGDEEKVPALDMCTPGQNDECKAYGLECGLYWTRDWKAMRCI